MPLVKLQSDLVWRGPKPNFTPDTPIPNDSESRFIPPKAGKGAPMTPGLAVKPPVVRVEGIGVNGRPYFIKYITAKDDFPTKNSMFDMGIAKRSAQGGEGYPFPKSYKGEIYQWKPEPHTGFYETNRYEDLAVPSGDRRGFLRETYLSNTPIEDVYNRFNLREDSYNSSYIKEPYILRGIQREGSIDPQRWGGTSTSVIDFPRSGFASYSDRASNDVLRISKFLASPKGISYLTTQFGLQLMNPNVENRDGDVRTPLTEYKSNTKTFSPINLIANTAAAGLGLRLPRHGILGKGYDETYETVINGRDGDGKINNNRLVKLVGSSIIDSGVSVNSPFPILSKSTGPKSFLGDGNTDINRRVDSFKRDGTGIEQNTNLVSGTPAQRYSTLSYGKLSEIAKSRSTAGKNTAPNNFILQAGFVDDTSILPSQYGILKEANYDSNNIHTKYGVSNYSDPDPIEGEDGDDFIDFKFTNIEGTETIRFRAFLTQLSENHMPNWEGIPYQGIAYEKWLLTSYRRNVGLGFKIASFSKADLSRIYEKMSKLVKYTMPSYNTDYGFTGKFIKLTVGSLYKEQVMILDSLDYSWDTETPWEIDPDQQLPIYTEVNLNLIYIGNNMPDTNNPDFTVFDYNFGSSQNRERPSKYSNIYTPGTSVQFSIPEDLA